MEQICRWKIEAELRELAISLVFFWIIEHRNIDQETGTTCWMNFLDVNAKQQLTTAGWYEMEDLWKGLIQFNDNTEKLT